MKSCDRCKTDAEYLTEFKDEALCEKCAQQARRGLQEKGALESALEAEVLLRKQARSLTDYILGH